MLSNVKVLTRAREAHAPKNPDGWRSIPRCPVTIVVPLKLGNVGA